MDFYKEIFLNVIPVRLQFLDKTDTYVYESVSLFLLPWYIFIEFALKSQNYSSVDTQPKLKVHKTLRFCTGYYMGQNIQEWTK